MFIDDKNQGFVGISLYFIIKKPLLSFFYLLLCFFFLYLLSLFSLSLFIDTIKAIADAIHFTDEHNAYMINTVSPLFKRISEEGKLPKTTASKTSAGQVDIKLTLAEQGIGIFLFQQIKIKL